MAAIVMEIDVPPAEKNGARLLNCWTFGTVLLMAWNLLPLPHVGINPISSLLTGALGISGLPLTVFLNMMP